MERGIHKDQLFIKVWMLNRLLYKTYKKRKVHYDKWGGVSKQLEKL